MATAPSRRRPLKEDQATSDLKPGSSPVKPASTEVNKPTDTKAAAAAAKDQQAKKNATDSERDTLAGFETFTVVESLYQTMQSIPSDELKSRQAAVIAALTGTSAPVISEDTKELLKTIAKDADGKDVVIPEAFQRSVEQVITARTAAKLAEEKERMVAHAKARLAESEKAYAKKLQEDTATSVKYLVGRLDSYLDVAVNQWLTENKLVAEKGVRASILENFYRNTVRALRESGIDAEIKPTVKSKIDAVLTEAAAKDAKIAELTASLNESREREIAAKRKLTATVKSNIIEDATRGFSVVQKQRVLALAEGQKFDSMQDFQTKVKLIAEEVSKSKATPAVKPLNEDLAAATKPAADAKPLTESAPPRKSPFVGANPGGY